MGIPTKINNATFRVIVLFLLIHFNVDNIYSQFSLAPNGVTIVCPGASSGDTGVVDGVTYTAVNRSLLISKRNAGQDLSLCCTTPVTNMSSMFSNWKNKADPNIANWDMSNVTNTSNMFFKAWRFDVDIGAWDMSSVTNMKRMFFNADDFNQDIGDWDVSSVTNMEETFFSLKYFNQDLNDWDVSNVTNMALMFYDNKKFNQDLNDWDVSKVENMNKMFGNAVKFNGDITGWNPSSVTNMNQMFWKAYDFNQPIKNWDVSSVTNMTSMFELALSFNGDIGGQGNNASSWDVSSVTSMQNMFKNADNFKRDLCDWDVSSVTTMKAMFAGADEYNRDITCWDTSSVTNMDNMFQNAGSYNQDLSGLCAEGVSSAPTNFGISNSSFLPQWGESCKTDISITFGDITETYGNPNFNLSASSPSTGAYSYSIADGSVATVSGNTVTIQGVGTTIVTVNQATDSNYNSATATMTLTINKGNPVISFSDITKTTIDPDFNLSATSSSTGSFTYSSSDGSVATLIGNSASIQGVGSTIITLNQAADANYNSASASMTLTVVKTNPGITFSNITKTTLDPDFNLSATSSSTGAFTYSISDGSVATVSGNKVTIIGAGSTIVTVVQEQDINFNSATKTMLLTVNKVNPVISISDITKEFDDSDFNLSATSSSTGAFSYSISDGGIASISGNTVTILGAGTTQITVNQTSDNNYNSTTKTITLTVNRADQYITVGDLPTVQPLKDFTSLPISAISSSGAPVVITLSAGSAASLSGTVSNYELTSINQTGVVTITFTTDPSFSSNYNVASIVLTIDVVKSNQNIIFDPEPPESLYYIENLGYTINASSSSFLGVDYQLITPVGSNSGVTLTDNSLAIDYIGIVSVRITQLGNNIYNMAAPKVVEINILKGQTTLSSFGIPDKLIIDDDFQITPPSSSRVGVFEYTSSDPSIAIISGDKITITGIGSTIITATQLESDKYSSSSISAAFIVNDLDTDGDGIGDTIDTDDDNDGYSDVNENLCLSDPLDPLSTPLDTDGDFIPDCVDVDDDGDGVLDTEDVFPLDGTEWTDTDGDGIGNNADLDDDGDGYSDEDEIKCLSDSLNGLSTPTDNDNDFIADCTDLDDDNDGYPDEIDNFPFDPSEWLDTDGDGEGNNQDNDDDGDGIPDSEEDNLDTDGDGIRNDLDDDDDGDGIPTALEDANGNGDPTDDDADGDGIYDALESDIYDSDSDGVVDKYDDKDYDPNNDSDGDGIPNIDEKNAGSDPLDNTDYPEDFKSNGLDFKITNFFSPNGDGIGDLWKIDEVDRYPKSQVWIFSKTGKQIFSASPYQNNWDGQFKGNLLPSGSYYYRLDLNGNGKIDFEGWLYLQR